MMKQVLAAIALLAGVAPAVAQGQDRPSAPGRLIGTALNVADLDAAVKFYTQGLGMKVATTIDLGARTETILMFGDDPTQPSILLMHDKDPANAKPLIQGNAFSRIVIGVADVEATAARLTALGYQHGPVRNATHGARIVMTTDPAGFALEIVQHSGVN
jgi:lactoylglutathione lyase